AEQFEPAKELNRALKNRSLAAFLDHLPPLHPEYHRLMDALAQYRAIAASGGWPNVPASKKGAKIEAKDSRLPVLVKRLATEDAQFTGIRHPSTDDIREAVKRFQGRNGLEADGHLGSDTLTALNVSPAARAATIAANMERWRWVPHAFERRY